MAIDIIVDVGPQGPQGSPGVDGKTVLNGTVNPLSGDGVNGDFYINTTTETIFGPKTAGVWGVGTSLVGPQGPQGSPGAAGNPGGADTQVQFNDAGQFNANSGFTYNKNTNTVTCDNLVIALPTNRFLFTDNASKVITINGWSWDATTTGAQVNLDQVLDDTGGRSVQNYQMNLIPSMASPSSNYNQFNIQTYIDPTSTGFDAGTDGTLSNNINAGFTHQGTSNIGSLNVFTSYSSIGNGTDPIDVKGYGGFFVFGDFNDNVNISGPFQGFIFQPHVHTSASFSTGGAYSNIFNDAANVETFCDGWNSFTASPQLAGVHNNTNYFGLNINPSIGVMQGNAQYVGAYLGGAVATMSTSGVTGLQVNPQMQSLISNSKGIGVFGQSVSGSAEWVGVDVSTNQINTTGAIRGIRVNVDGQDLSLDHIALGCDGRVNISSNANLASGLGQVSIHSMGGQITIPPGVAITGTDTIGNLLAIGIDTGDSGSSWTSTGSPVGLSTLGFVGFLNGAGTINGGINFCLNGYQATHTGHIDRVVNYFAAAIPGGAGTMDESILFYGDFPFGSPATSSWGLRVDSPLAENYVGKLAVGSMASKKVLNSSVGIELDSTSQAFLPSRMTTTERDALTAVNGMIIYNTSAQELQGYQNGAWSPLSGGGTVPRNLTAQWLTVDGATLTVTHNWGTRNIRVEVIDNGSNYETIVTDVSRPTANTVVLTSSEAPATAWTVLLTEVLN